MDDQSASVYVTKAFHLYEQGLVGLDQFSSLIQEIQKFRATQKESYEVAARLAARGNDLENKLGIHHGE